MSWRAAPMEALTQPSPISAQQLQEVHHQYISPLSNCERPIIQKVLRLILAHRRTHQNRLRPAS